MPPPGKDFAHLGATLRRVKVAERATDEGGKRVWHQGEGGVEVVSFVDAQGRVLRQECYLGREAVLWRAGQPLCTGTVRGEGRGQEIAPSELLILDDRPSVGPLRQASELLKGAPQEDRYLAHLRQVVDAAAEGLAAREGEVVTRSRASVGEDGPAEVTAAPPPRSAQGRTWGWIAVGSMAVAVAALAYLVWGRG